jgi:MtaA/CmuA family methyltransferase
MSSLDRYLGVLRGTPVDFLPRTPILMRFAAEHLGVNYARFASDYRVLVQANAKCAADFGMDQVSCICDPYRETQGFGGIVEYVENGIPRCTHPLADSKDLALLQKPDPVFSPRMLNCVRVIEAYNSQLKGQYSILGWIEGPAAEAADLRDVNNFLVDLVKDRGFACELMDLCVEVGIEYARAQVAAGADTIGVGDSIASQVSPRLYESLIQPRERRLIQAIKEMGVYVKLHICGNITHLLPGLADIDMDVLDVDHMVDMPTVRRQLGSKVTLTGNIDPVAGVFAGTPASIRDTIRRTYEQVGNPYFVNAGCEIPPGTPPENLQALCEPLPYRA